MVGEHRERRSRPFRLAVLMGDARAWLAWMRIEAEREKFDSHGAKIDLPVEKRFRRIFVIGGNIDSVRRQFARPALGREHEIDRLSYLGFERIKARHASLAHARRYLSPHPRPWRDGAHMVAARKRLDAEKIEVLRNFGALFRIRVDLDVEARAGNISDRNFAPERGSSCFINSHPSKREYPFADGDA